jgi:hypothetical protein
MDKSVKERVGAIIVLELILIGFALTMAALRGNALILVVAIAWLVQAGALFIVLTKIGEQLKAGGNK